VRRAEGDLRMSNAKPRRWNALQMLDCASLRHARTDLVDCAWNGGLSGWQILDRSR
jgi:hypothetical protein